MVARRLLAAVFLAMGVASTHVIAEEISDEAIKKAVEQLGADRFLLREEASELLWQAGELAREALTAASHSNDREVVKRVGILLEKLDLGIRPDTPPEQVAFLIRYRDADVDGRRNIIADLRKQADFPLLLLLLQRERDQSVRDVIARKVLGEREALVRLLLQGDRATFDKVMEFAEHSTNHGELYAVYLLVTGKLDVKLRAITAPANDNARMLAAKLLRLRGRTEESLELVRQISTPDARHPLRFQRLILEAELLQATGRWAEMAKLAETENFSGVDQESEIEKLGVRAYFHRMAGNQAKCDELLTQVKLHAKQHPDKRWMCTEALLVNDRFEDALQLAIDFDKRGGFPILVAQTEYRRALELIDYSITDASASQWYDHHVGNPQENDAVKQTELRWLVPQVAKLLARVGRRQQASELLERAFAHAVREVDVRYQTQIVGIERELQLVPRWKQHAAQLLQSFPPDQLTPKNPHLQNLTADRTDMWWPFFRKRYPDDELLDTLERIDELIGPRWGSSGLNPEQREMVEWAINESSQMELTLRQQHLMRIGQLCLHRSADDLARRCFDLVNEAQPTEEAWLSVGDIAARQAEWDEAAEAYAQAWRISQKPLPLYLQADAISKLGRAEESESMRQMARLLSMDRLDDRQRVSSELQQHGLSAEAAFESQLVLRLGSVWTTSFGNALQEAGNLVAKENPLQAANYWERLRFSALRDESSFYPVSDHFSLAKTIHRTRARGLLADDRPKDAWQSASLALDADPGDVETAIYLHKSFDAADQHEFAAKIVARMHEKYAELCEDFPHAGFAHNSLAWLIVNTGGDLDEAVVHAHRAVELDADNPAPIDTLALVHFRRGEIAEAIVHARRCVELAPGEPHFVRQLREFESALEAKP